MKNYEPCFVSTDEFHAYTAAAKFAKVWGGDIHWVFKFGRMRMGQFEYRLEQNENGWAIYEISKEKS